MDTTFISIHDLTSEARLLYSSDSVIDVLGYTPEELVNKSLWNFFPPEELPYARSFHQKKVTMDKAAVLVYCKVKAKNGEWVGCECCFTICYDVMIVCTSRYRQTQMSHDRAMAAPIVRRIFTSSPRDPRYHMLSHLSTKFSAPPVQTEFEPRAALFLNRFTRTLTIMYATHGIKDVIGISAKTMQGLSFYYCVAENCLQDAVKCLENAKGNHSIAYLRFWYRDPRRGQPRNHNNTGSTPAIDPLDDDDGDEEMTDIVDSEAGSEYTEVPEEAVEITDLTMDAGLQLPQHDSDTRASSGDSAAKGDSHEDIFGDSPGGDSSTSSIQQSSDPDEQPEESFELEAVVSCASDGLVVCLRRARPMIPHPAHRPGRRVYPNGLFAAPWAADPLLPPLDTRPQAGFGSSFAPALGPMAARHHDDRPPPPHGPPSGDFMAAIREQAIFAWALTGINGAIADFGYGKPASGGIPDGGLNVWASDANTHSNSDSETRRQNASSRGDVNGPGATSSHIDGRVRAPGPPYNDEPPPYDSNERSSQTGRSYNDANGHSSGDFNQRPTAVFGDEGIPQQR